MLPTAEITQYAPLDVIVIALVFLALTFLIYRSGVYRASAIILALLATQAVVLLSGSAVGLGTVVHSFDSASTQGIFFIVIFVGLFFLTERMFFSFGGLFGGLSHAVMASLAVVATALVVWNTSPALTALWHLSPIIATIFSLQYAVYWVVGSLAVLGFIST